ncbi:hypothetical protein [Candidatus Leptofilum sp.]|uniref:hypothetical protein n=1 Tax=Candidatus Leptofilum sp. TaxID=3241576 RepID=UPI003B5C4F11
MKLLLLLLMLCLGGTAVILLTARIFWGGVLQEPTSVDVQLDAPAQVVLGEPFEVTLHLTNLITASQTLHSIDIATGYLDNVPLNRSEPAYTELKTLPLSRFTMVTFEQEIPVDGSTTVTLQFVGEAVGTFEGILDVCLQDGTLCLAVPLETAVVER